MFNSGKKYQEENASLKEQLREANLENNRLKDQISDLKNETSEKLNYLDKIPTPVMVVDESFEVKYMNNYGAKTVGKTPEDCVGKKCYDLFNTGHCNTDNCQVAKAMKQDGVFTSDTVAKLPTGELPIRYTGAPLKDKNGKIIGGLEYVVDISEEMEMINSVSELVNAAIEGKLDTRANQKIVQGLNNTLDTVINPLNVVAEYVDRISKGDMPPEITDEYKGDFNEIKNNLNQCIWAISEMLKDANMLTDAVVEGKLDVRADASKHHSKHQGDFQKIVQGLNNTLDTVINPLNVVAEYVDRISKGEIPEKITDKYKGDFNEIINNLNKCIDGFGGLVEANQVLQKMAKKDLSCKVEGNYLGIFNDVKIALNEFLESVNEILHQVTIASEQVSTGSKQVSDSSQSLSQGASEQASSIEEISSTMTEMTSQTKDNAENAAQANKLAEEAKANADRGNGEMKKMLEAMNEINSSSEQISKIIKVIDEIAFQTNLLALNAAVEAARAGKHGKGFAVVADEVRNLAQRSAEAAKETTELIENSVNKVQNGTEIAESTAKALEEIVTRITKVTDLVGEIASASDEQSKGIAQVNEGLGQIDQVTQSNTSVAEESASASEELSSQAEQLKAMIAEFKLRNGERIEKAKQAAAEKVRTRDGEGHKKVEETHQIVFNNKKEGDGKEKYKDVISLDDKDFGKY